MANDLAAMKTRIADELARTDLTSQIATAINDAIKYYQSKRFRFNESRDMTFTTTAGQDFYGAAANANIPTLMAFDDLILYLAGIPWPLYRDTPHGVELFNQNGLVAGQPTRYCYYNNQIRIGPVPDQTYTLRIAGQVTFAAPASDSEADNPWMIDGEALIRTRAKKLIGIHVTMDPDLVTTMDAMETDELANLKGVANRITATGRIAPMRF